MQEFFLRILWLKKNPLSRESSTASKSPPNSGNGQLTLGPFQRTNIQEALSKGLRVVPVAVENQMKEAYLDYAMSVIIGRALPDVRDGLKPVHRRILYAMHERAWRHDRSYVKCAKIVGEVIGNYHPHGDSAVYETLVRMAQEFAMSIPLVDGQGNFGSIDGDRPAAYRYTEARLSQVAGEMLRDIDRQTVDFNPNFDGSRNEPTVLPSAFPNLLVNGSSGIAVGMATNIPPHNLGEVIAATLALIKDPDISIKKLANLIPAPDFPTGGIIIGGEGLQSAYASGKGALRIRARTEIENSKRGRDMIVITEIPYQVNKRTLLEKIGELVQTKSVEGIADIRDLSDRHGIRVEIELKKESNVQVILNQLFKQTQMQVSYGINLIALVKGQPRLLNLKEILSEYVRHRREVLVRRLKYELKQAENRAHILEGLKIALDSIEAVIKLIRSSQTVEAARKGLIQNFKLSEIQANAILDMRLQKLTSLESQKIIDELAELKKKIKELKTILQSEEKQYGIISEELGNIQKQYSGKRRTEIDRSSVDTTDFDVVDLIADEEVVITLTKDNFIKRVARDSFRRQKRGGRGVSGGVRGSDMIKCMLVASTHDTLLFFSNRGKIFAMQVHELPEASREARGRSIKAMINLTANETISAMASTRNFDSDYSIIMATKTGILKRSELSSYSNIRKGGIIAIGMRKDDELIDVRLLKADQDIILCSRMGNALRTKLSKIRSQGRSATGIIGIRLDAEDLVIGMDVIEADSSLFVISEKGYGKRVDYKNFAAKGRGGRGMTYLKITDKNGPAVRISSVREKDDIVVIAQSGMTIRLSAKDVSQIGRATVGVRLVNLSGLDHVKDVALIADD